MKIKISDLQPNTGQIDGVPSNPRTITEKDFEDLKDSLTRNPDNIKKFPLVIAEHKKQLVVISGNQRLRAMQALGWTELEHVGEIYPDGTDPEILKEAVIIANTHKGEWDWDLLANGEWPEDKLTDWGIDIPEDWGEAHNTNPEEDEIPEPPKTPVSKLGDLWLLDGHRVLCGDSTDQATVELLMDGKKADMVFTDPPYGMDVDVDYDKMFSKDKTHKSKGERFDKVIGDDGYFDPTFLMDYADEVLLWGADYYCQSLPLGGSWFVWDKRTNDSMDKVVGNTFELCWSKQKHKKEVARILWSGHHGMAKDDSKTRLHPTQKPVALIDWCFERLKGRLVLDLFLGSGSTLIACEQTDRTCYGLELDPAYVDVICKRWQTLTGQMPILESTGEAHDFLEG